MLFPKKISIALVMALNSVDFKNKNFAIDFTGFYSNNCPHGDQPTFPSMVTSVKFQKAENSGNMKLPKTCTNSVVSPKSYTDLKTTRHVPSLGVFRFNVHLHFLYY